MALNNADKAIIDQRRRLVATMLLRKLTQREICEQLAEKGLKNPETGEAYSLATINGDVKALRREWRKDASKKIEEFTAQMLAEYEEVKRAAWAKGQLFNVLRALDAQRDMLGLSGVKKMDFTSAGKELVFNIGQIPSPTEGN